MSKRVDEVFEKHHDETDLPLYMNFINEILDDRTREMIQKHHINDNERWFRTRFVSTLNKKWHDDAEDENYVNEVIDINMNVTKFKEREVELQSREKKNIRLLLIETAVKEASKLKS